MLMSASGERLRPRPAASQGADSRDANEDLKKAEKAGEISQDEQKKMETEVQKDTDAAIKRIDEALRAKEVEIMQV